MRNRTYRSLSSEEQTRKHILTRNPFDNVHWEMVVMMCSTCRESILPWPIQFQYDHAEYLYDGLRIKAIIERGINNHKKICAQFKKNEETTPEPRISEAEMMSGRIFIEKPKQIFPGLSRRCSGYGVFVGGEKCTGCPDCTKPIDQDPEFKINQWVINTTSGDIWQLSESEVIKYNSKKFDNIKHYS